MIKIDSAVSYKDMLNIVNPKTGELRHSLMTLKVEGRVKLTSDKYEFTVSDGMVARNGGSYFVVISFLHSSRIEQFFVKGEGRCVLVYMIDNLAVQVINYLTIWALQFLFDCRIILIKIIKHIIPNSPFVTLFENSRQRETDTAERLYNIGRIRCIVI